MLEVATILVVCRKLLDSFGDPDRRKRDEVQVGHIWVSINRCREPEILLITNLRCIVL